MDDTVNVASRLEGANKYFGTTIMAAKSTFERAAPGFAWRELDSIRVQGRDEPVSVYEPLARHGEETPEQKVVAAAYQHALACWRRRDFAGCIAALAPIAAAGDPVAPGQEISGASAGARLGRRQHAGREVTALTGPTLVPLISPRKRESSKISHCWVPAYAGRAVKVAKRPSLRRDRFEPAFGHRRPEHADHDKDNRHRAGNEAEHPERTVTGEKERDDEAGKDR